MIKSLEFDQNEILRSIIELHCPNGFDVDVTYGNGSFYKEIPHPKFKFDIQPLSEGVIMSDSSNLPMEDRSASSMIFDPPFITYVRQGREGNGNMVMAKRFGGYWRYEELEAHYSGTIKEAARILVKKGILVVKCQDIVHNHKLHCTHAKVIEWAEDSGFRLLDLFVLGAKHRLGHSDKTRKQKHSRIFHSYFLVFVKK